MDTRKQPNRFLAILLSLCMLFTMLPVGSITAFAAGDVEVIETDTTWEAMTLSKDVQIASGVTVTVNGAITIDGEVTISGGGKIIRGSNSAYFNIDSGDSLTLDGVTVDGKSTQSYDSMFTVDRGTLDIKSSTIQNCSASGYGGAINMAGGTLTIGSTTIQGCSATSRGGAIYLDDGATATITSGTFSGNKTTNTIQYGGGFIYNRGSTLTIEGGSFLNNSSAGRGGAVYNTAIADTKTYIRGGVFEGNTSSYSGYVGSGAVFYSSEYEKETVLYISGSVQFGDGTANDGTDGVYLDSYSSTSTLRKMQISSALQYPVHIYVACSENRAIAGGVAGYTLTAADMMKIQFHDVDSSGTNWYAWLDSENNEVNVSATEPLYVIYDSNGATGSVTDNTIYTSGNNTVTVKSSDGLTYEGHAFTGWNTRADGSGTAYQPRDTFNITETTTLYAQWEAAASETYDVWAGGVQVTEENASDVLGEADGDGATVIYDASTNTVTLNGASITTGYATTVGSTAPRDCGVYADLDDGRGLTVKLVGENTINLMDTETESMGIVLPSGAGTLNVTGEEGAKLTVKTTLQCLRAYDGMSITGGTYDLTSDNGGENSGEAIYSAGQITIDGADLTAVGVKNRGIWMSNSDGEDLVIQNSTLNVTGGSTHVGCAGIFSNGGIEITNSIVTATGDANGIAASNGEIIISGANTVVTATSNQVEGNDPEESAAILGGGYYWNPQPITLSDGLSVVEPEGVTIGQYNGLYATLDAEGNYAASAVIKVPGAVTYNVWVGGVQVTEENASDVFGEDDGDGATVTYNPETKTLTLDGASITSTYDEVPGGGNVAILSYDDLNIVLAEGSENKITLNGDKFFTGVTAVSEDGTNNDVKDINVSGNGSLNIDVTTSYAAAFGIMGYAVTIDGGAEVNVTVNGTSTAEMTAYIGVMGYSSVAIQEGSVVTAAVNDNAGENIAVMSTGAVTIDNANVTAGGYTGIMGATGVSISGASTVTATGSAYAIASGQNNNITWDDGLTAEGRANAQSGELETVTTNVATADGTDHSYNTFVLSSGINTIAQYVEIGLGPSLHSHAICGETDCSHDGHTAVNYTALPSNISGQILNSGNYYLTGDITDVSSSILITGTVNLCLNGHEISGNAENGIFRVGAGGVLTVCDCAGKGTITETGSTGHNPIFLHSGGTLNLYSGTIQSRITAVVIDEDPSSGSSNSEGGMVNVYGGTVTSSGSRSQAIKVNAGMTNAAVNIYGGEVTSSYRGIWASSGEICISGGTISADSYALHIDNSAARVYLSGSPVISGGSSDLRILPTSSAANAVLVFHAKDDANSEYTGGSLSVSLTSTTADYYVAQDVTGSGMLAMLSLTDDNYSLAYDEASKAIQIKANTHTVTLQGGDGYTLTAQSGSSSPVQNGGSYSFTLTISDGWYTTNSFAVRANGTDLTPDSNGVYTIENITENQIVTVNGLIEAENTIERPTLQGMLGENGWYISDVRITPPDDYEISATFNGTYEEEITLSQSVGEDYTVYLKRLEDSALFKGIVMGPIKIDKDRPTISVEGDTTTIAQSDTVKFTVFDGTSGVAAVYVRKGNSGPWTEIADYQNGYTVKENGTYQFMVEDNAGVESSIAELTYGNIDTQKPVVTIVATHGGETYMDGTWTNEDITLSVSNSIANLGDTKFEYRVGEDGAWQTYSGAITINQDTNGTLYSFRATSEAGVESEEVSITVKRDTAAPDGDIKIEENSVKAFINAVTFGLFYNENVDVTISGSDALSDVASVLYYASEEILHEEQIESLTDEDWTTYTGTINVTAADAVKFIYYVKVTDNAGNSTYFASNGATFDLTDPVISGVTNGGIYYTTQTVQVTDANLDTVTLNGQTAGSQITLAGNVATDMDYTIFATDKAGNTTTVTVTMKPTADLGDAVEGIEPDNVNSSDKKAIEDYLNDLNTRLEDENLTDAEKEAIQDLIDDAQDLLDKIEEVEQTADTENIQQAEDVTIDNVKPEDKEVLEAAKDDIEKALEDYGDNYTADEKKQLEDTLEQIKSALEVIQRVEDVEEAIGELPESVSPDDTEAAEQIETVKEQYDALSEHGQSLISDEAMDKLNVLLAQLGDYRIIEGDGSTWTRESAEGLTFVANGAYIKFTGIEIDGAVISAENYTADSGSTKIVLTTNYLNTLTVGQHNIAVLYTDGEAQGTFNIAEKPTEPTDTTDPADEDSATPETGDSSHIIPWIILMLISGGAVLTLNIRCRSKRT